MKPYAYIYLVIYLLFIVVISVLPFFSSEEYSIVKNSINELGSQQTPRSWIINFTIALISIATLLLGRKALQLKTSLRIVLYIFCTSFFLTTIFKITGVNFRKISFDEILHSFFSNITGLAFCFFCLLLLWQLKLKKHRIQTLVILIIVLILSFLFFNIPEMKGFFQRIMFIIVFGWLFIAFVQYPLKVNYKKP